MSKELSNRDNVGLPPWLAAMREAMEESITADDVKAIVANQVKLAKEGNRAAIDWVTKQALEGGMRGATLIQNNFYGTNGNPVGPSEAKPGSPEKIERMRQRAAAHMPLHHRADGSAEDE